MGLAVSSATFMRKARRLVASFVPLILAVSSLSVISSPSANAASGSITNGSCTSTVGETAGASIAQVGNDCVLTFTASSQTATSTSNSWTVPTGVREASILVVAGGGAGGIRHGGGGGAGGLVYLENVGVVVGNSMAVTVGGGGAGSAASTCCNGTTGASGNNSTLTLKSSAVTSSIITAVGGGGGSGNNSSPAAGGSSGGSAYSGTAVVAANQSGQNYGYGNIGAIGNTGADVSKWGGGGGGGAGGAGSAGSDGTTPGRGGLGSLNSITGTAVCYAAGGGGGVGNATSSTLTNGGQCTGSTTPVGGSGTSGNTATPGVAAANTGSGGGGGGFDTGNNNSATGAGAAGVVIIRWTLPSVAGAFPNIDGLSARFNANNFNTTLNSGLGTWADTSGSGYHIAGSDITGTAITVGTTGSNANGSNKSFTVVNGTSTSNMEMLSAAEMTGKYTLFTVARYSGASKGRIFQATAAGATNHLSGFYNGMSGIYHKTFWQTVEAQPADISVNNWLLSSECSYDPNVNTIVNSCSATYSANGKQRNHVTNTITTASFGIGINDKGFYTAQDSDFQIADVLVFNRVLTITEENSVEQYLSSKYGIGIYSDVIANYDPGDSTTTNKLLKNLGKGDGTLVEPLDMTLKNNTFKSSENSGILKFGLTNGSYGETANTMRPITRFSASVWMKEYGTQSSGWNSVFTTAYNVANQPIAPMIGTYSKNVDAGFYDGGTWRTGFGNLSSSSQPLTDDAWYHVSTTYDGINVRIYINGVLKSTTPSTASTLKYDAYLRLGTRWDLATTTYGFNGDVGKTKMYDHALTDAEVLAEYNADASKYVCSSTTQTTTTKTVITFTKPGSCNWTAPAGVTSVRTLLVGGGGGGGAWVGGGGGGGGVIDNSAVTVTPGTSYPIVIGGGGKGGYVVSGVSALGSSLGSNTTALGLTAYGGGGGGTWNTTGSSGATGGGGSYNNTIASSYTAQGFAGGKDAYDSGYGYPTGGGGGAGAVGVTGTVTTNVSGQSGAGGAGRTSDISGTTTYYGGGGGGGCHGSGTYPCNVGAGGTGGGGGGAGWTSAKTSGVVLATSGTASTGGGGGGAGAPYTNTGSVDSQGGEGGSGVVVISYPTPPVITLSTSTITGTVGAALTGYTISNTGGEITSYSISPSLTDSGLIFSTSTGLLSGTPSAVATSTTYTVTATNGSGSSTATFSYVATLTTCSPTSSSSGGYTTLTFSTVQTCSWSVPAGVTAADVLVVGGGGGGSANWSGSAGAGGSGGGGGVYTATGVPISGSLNVKVGSGGANGISTTSQSGRSGSQGGTSSFGTLTAGGGGGGGCETTATNGQPCGAGTSIHGLPGTAGGNGGSPSNFWNAYNYGSAGTATSVVIGGKTFNAVTGYQGGIFVVATSTGNSAGSAGGAGGAGTYNTPGAGVTSSLTGSTVYGKGGSSWNASTWNLDALPANTGWGGNGAYSATGVATNGIAGSSGVVVVKYVNAPVISLSATTINSTVGTAVTSYTISNSGGAAASYSISPSLAVSGLTFSTSTGQISGTPTTATSSATYTITATNTSGTSTATFAIDVANANCSPSSSSSGGYVTLTFTSTTACNWNVPTGISTSQILVVGGGGGGGDSSTGYTGGAGGAGGYFYSSSVSINGTIVVSVGAGGTGATSSTTNGTAGGNSAFGTLKVGGGGYGNSYSFPTSQAAGSGVGGSDYVSGGSGGGGRSRGAGDNNAKLGGSGGSIAPSGVTFLGTTYTGFAGAAGSDAYSGDVQSGGMGGAITATNRTSSISGTSVIYAKGGTFYPWDSGSNTAAPKTYGSGGSTNYNYGSAETAGNTLGGDGAQGVVIVKYASVVNFTYNANNGTGTAPAGGSVQGGTTFSTVSNSFNRNGYTFAGWNTAANGTGTSLTANASNTMPVSATDIVLYAQWTAVAVSITTPTSGLTGSVGASYSLSISASGGSGSGTYSIASGTLPAGLSLNSTTGVISGTPTSAGTSAISILFTDANTATATTSSFSIVVNSNDAKLSALTLSAGTLSPTFASATTTYTASVASSVSTITVTPTRNQANATITVNGTAVNSGSASSAISLNTGSNTITVVVTAQDGTTTSTYTITVTRATSTDATLSAVSLSAGTLSPAFASATTSYSASVSNSNSSITLTPTVNQANATIQVKVGAGAYASVTSGSASGSLSLAVGTNAISILVTAQDGTTTSTYSISVTRLPVVPTITKFDVQVKSDNTSLVPNKTLTSLLSANYSPTYAKYQTVDFTVNATTTDAGVLTWQIKEGTNCSSSATAVSGSTGLTINTTKSISTWNSSTCYVVEVINTLSGVTSSVVSTYQFLPQYTTMPVAVNATTAANNLSGVVGASYSNATPFSVSGGGGSWQYYLISAPAGLSINVSTGAITGTFTTVSSGTAAYIKAVDANGGSAYAVVGPITWSVTSGSALTPSFGTPTSTSDGFTVQISNYNASFTWAGTATASGTVAISNTGLVTVTGVAANTSSVATITTTRSNYTSGSATVSATSLASYTISYSGGAGATGSAPTSPLSVYSNATFTTPANTYLKSGYTFAGWSDGTNVFAAGATYPSSGNASGNVTLTATWTANSNTVVFDTQGGSAVNSITWSTATSLTLPAAPTRTGYSFKGWFDAATGGNQIIKNALNFDGTNDRVTIPHSTAFNFSTGLTLEAWINTTATRTQYITTKGDDSFFFALDPAGKLAIYLNGVATSWFYSSTAVNDGNWHHVAATYNGSVLKGYIDGVEKISYTKTASLPSGTSAVEIGSRTNSSGTAYSYNFTGKMYDVRYWNVARTASEISSSMNSQLTGTETGLVAAFLLNQGAPSSSNTGLTSVTNTVSGADNGTLSGFALSGGTSNWVQRDASYNPSNTSGFTLYAQWSLNSYSISYAAGSGSGTAPTSPLTVNYGATFTTPTNTFTRAGYTFASWSDGTNTYAENATYPSTGAVAGNVTLTATWTANSLTVTYNSQGGSSVTAGSVNTGASISTAPTAPTKAGYTLSGWSTTSSGSVITFPYAHGQTASFTLYAIWSANALTITYDSQGGSSVTAGSVNTGANILSAPTAPTKAGYAFSGWSTTSSGSVITFPYSHGQTASFTVYAIWSANALTVTYDSQGGSATSNGSTATAGSIASAPGAPTKANYTFAGWAATIGGSAITFPYSHGQTANFTLYAKWTANQYTVTYAYNSATGGNTTTSDSFTTGDTAITLPTPTRTGYTFAGWHSDADLTISIGTTYSPTGTSLTPTVYAKWNPINYSVTYNAATATGGVLPTDSANYNIGNNVVIKGNTGSLVRTGYSFAGWTAASDGTGTVLTSGTTFITQSSNMNFYAKWTANTYTVTYNVNGATGTPSATTANYTTGGATVTLATVGTMTKTGYDFAGWSTSPTGSLLSGGYTTSADVTLYAKWTVKSISITYAKGDASSSSFFNFPNNTSANYGTSITLNGTVDSTITIAGVTHAFMGWNDGNSVYQGGSTYLIGESAPTFTATWVQIYAVRYAFNGGTAAANSSAVDAECLLAGSTCANGQVITSNAAPSRVGYTFAGWTDQTGASVPTAGTFTVSATRYLLYANWTAIDYAITYDSNGGSAAPAGLTKKMGESFIVEAAPTRGGYTFAGWSDSITTHGAGVTYQVGASAVSLVAQWNPKVYKVTYDWNGGSGTATSDDSYTVGNSGITLPTVGDHVKDGYTFSGWSTTSNGLLLSGAFVPTDHTTLYAIWGTGSYVVTYDAHGGSVTRSSDTVANGSTTSLPTPTRANFVFEGWHTQSIDGDLIGQPGDSFKPTSSRTLHAQWTQTSIYGISPTALTRIGNTTARNAASATFSSSNANSSVSVTVPAGSLPDGTNVNFDLVGDFSRAQSVLSGTNNYIISMVVSWLAPDGTVPTAASGKEISVTITNSSIKAGASVYAIVSGNATLLGTATQNGTVTVNIATDPEVVVVATKSSAPRNVSGTSNGIKQSVVTWDAPTSDGGAAITSYTATSSSGQTCATSSLSCTITGLSDGTSYTFTVTATNSVGTSVASSASTSATTASFYTVTFNPKGGTSVANGSFASASTVSEPTAPTRSGYTFAGWSATDGGTAETFPYAPGVTTNITMYAKWTALDNAITFDSKSGSSVTSAVFPSGGTVSEPTAPTKSGYTFAGWAATDGGSAVTFPYAPGVTAPITLYANWTAGNYIVTFNSKGGSSVSSGQFTTGGTVSEPTAPTRSGYTFAGWSATDGGTALTFPYAPGVTSAITLYANWTAVSQSSSGGGGGGSSTPSTPAPAEPSGPTVPVKNNVTVVAPVTVVGDQETQGISVPISTGTGTNTKPPAITLDAASDKFIAEVKVVDGKLVLTPETGFSGKKTVTVTITENGADRIIQIPLTVLPEAVTKPTLIPASATKSVIKWAESPNADAYTVYLNGKKVCATSGTSCTISKILGPDATIEIVSNGGDRTVSEKIEADFKQAAPIPVARLASSTNTKASLSKTDLSALDKLIAIVKSQGFGTVVISQITTTKKTEAAAAARIATIKKYVDTKLGSTEVTFQVVPPTSRTYLSTVSVKG